MGHGLTAGPTVATGGSKWDRTGRVRWAETAQRLLLLGSLTARQGDLDDALLHLEAAAEAAESVGQAVVACEARVTRASVLAALGDYDAAVPSLREEVARLEGVVGGEELLRDARAELEAYETLLGLPQA